MSTSSRPVSLKEDVDTDILGLKPTAGMFEALSTTEGDDHSHSAFEEGKDI